MKVSVLLPVYNAGSVLAHAIESILAQDYRDFDFIIIDDASTDDSRQIIRKYALRDNRIKAFYNEVNLGLAATLNKGLRLSEADLVVRMDQDDESLSHRIRIQSEFMLAWPEIVAAGSYVFHMGSKRKHDHLIAMPTDPAALRERLIRDNCIYHPSVILRREDVLTRGGYREEFRNAEDYDLWLRLSKEGKLAIIAEPLIRYRFSISGMTLSKKWEQFFYFNLARASDQNPGASLSELHALARAMRDTYSEQWFMRQVYDGTINELLTLRLYRDALVLSRKMAPELHRGEAARVAMKNVKKLVFGRGNHKAQGRRVEKPLSRHRDPRSHPVRIILRDATNSPKMFLLVPFRLIWYLLPENFKRSAEQTRIFKTAFSAVYPDKTFPSFSLLGATPGKAQLRLPWPPEKPLISVVIPCYNQGEWLREAVDSVQRQTFQDLEIIIVDDGSTDAKTTKVLEDMNAPRTSVIRQANRKLPGARNAGIRVAQGKYICCLDADDRIEPTYLEKCVVKMEYEDLDLCYSNLKEFGESSRTMCPGNFSLETLLYNNCVAVAAVFTKEIWERGGGYNEKMIHGFEDWDFWIRIAKVGARGGRIDEPLFLYRRRGGTMLDEALEKETMLYEQIKQNHQELFENRELLAARGNRKPTQLAVIDRNRNLSERTASSPAQKPHILVALPFMVIGGADAVMLQLVSFLRQQGFRLSLITTIPIEQAWGDDTRRFEQFTNEIFHLYRFLKQEHWRDFLFYLLRTRHTEAIMIVGSSFTYELLPEIRNAFPTIKVIDQLFNEVGHIENNRGFAPFIDHHIVASEGIRKKLVETFKEHREKVSVVIHGVDTMQEFNPDLVRVSPEKSHAIPREKFVVSYIGRFSEEKCPDVFVSIVDRLKDVRDLFFVMVGQGPQFKDIMAQIRSLDLGSIIHAPGIVDEIGSYLKLSKLLLLPSRIEGIPIVLLESLSMGVPVIASRVGGIPSVIKDYYNGFLCDVGDVDSFAQRILLTYRDQDLWQRLSRQSREFAVEHLDLRKMNQSYLHILQQLMRVEERLR